jgi:hypothetical protein
MDGDGSVGWMAFLDLAVRLVRGIFFVFLHVALFLTQWNTRGDQSEAKKKSKSASFSENLDLENFHAPFL